MFLKLQGIDQKNQKIPRLRNFGDVVETPDVRGGLRSKSNLTIANRNGFWGGITHWQL